MPIDAVEISRLQLSRCQVFDQLVGEDDVDVGGQDEPSARASNADVLRNHLKQRQDIGVLQRAVELRRHFNKPVGADAGSRPSHQALQPRLVRRRVPFDDDDPAFRPVRQHCASKQLMNACRRFSGSPPWSSFRDVTTTLRYGAFCVFILGEGELCLEASSWKERLDVLLEQLQILAIRSIHLAESRRQQVKQDGGIDQRPQSIAVRDDQLGGTVGQLEELIQTRQFQQLGRRKVGAPHGRIIV